MLTTAAHISAIINLISYTQLCVVVDLILKKMFCCLKNHKDWQYHKIDCNQSRKACKNPPHPMCSDRWWWAETQNTIENRYVCMTGDKRRIGRLALNEKEQQPWFFAWLSIFWWHAE